MQLGGVTLLFCLFIFGLLPSQYGAEVHSITSSHTLTEGRTLVSPGQTFKLGFFTTPNNSANKYLGLWHKSIFPRKYVWVANRDRPIEATDTLATLRIGSNGKLELVDGNNSSVWSANISNGSSAALLDDGNFVVKDVMGIDVWESFNNPSDSQLPGLSVGYDKGSGKQKLLTSWRSENDPSPGLFSIGLSADLPAQVLIWRNGSTPHWRSGPWGKSRFIGIPLLDSKYLNVTLVDNVSQGSRYFSFSLGKTPTHKGLAYADISSKGILRVSFSVSGKSWDLDYESWKSPCDSYGACGPFGVCIASGSPMCVCLKGFIPKSEEEWSKRNWVGGCVRRTNLYCQTHKNKSVSLKGNDGFFKMKGMKVPDFHEYLNSLAIENIAGCKIQCQSNCSCLAYAYIDGIGCLVWHKDLLDMQQLPASGVDLYIRLAHSEQGEHKPIKLIASLAAIGCMIIFVAIVFSLHRWRTNQKARRLESTSMTKIRRDGLREYIGKPDSSELEVYDFDSILIATDNFRVINKLGQGGFGPVYKGMLPDGKEIAVKRLSSSSGQGVEEFKNEMLLISNLQHKNLVRLMGCCVTEDERLLIYEFMPNKSLDSFLFDPTKRALLDWATRFNIILGVARGLLYLHHDSYVKVIHRDLKVSNILLDENMNPKISDFGLGRIVDGTQGLHNTQKVIGTRGYMAPEYVMSGIFSEKSDVYSFGVLVLEIISGKKNSTFYLHDQQLGFLANAWNLWNEGRALELVDEALGDSYSPTEVLECVHAGLLCVQDNVVDRPTMSEVLSCGEIDGSYPKRPVFTVQNSVYHPESCNENTNLSKNEISITIIEGR